ncbi:hypothetical protein BHE74_00047189 [Ensete ventricosum]|nr:hypothetical protein BHE74_00047189 [Ensete ventricosum]
MQAKLSSKRMTTPPTATPTTTEVETELDDGDGEEGRDVVDGVSGGGGEGGEGGDPPEADGGDGGEGVAGGIGEEPEGLEGGGEADGGGDELAGEGGGADWLAGDGGEAGGGVKGVAWGGEPAGCAGEEVGVGVDMTDEYSKWVSSSSSSSSLSLSLSLRLVEGGSVKWAATEAWRKDGEVLLSDPTSGYSLSVTESTPGGAAGQYSPTISASWLNRYSSSRPVKGQARKRKAYHHVDSTDNSYCTCACLSSTIPFHSH